ncbi:MAG: nicotinate-nucleotide adenylyltransferase [Lachnospiraceae bacterium]|nr:nicotinate-nucleotide adenylyltransferase [Lachnospiraceae bacterium]
MGKKVGILGGTFNPIHLGHLILAEHALCEYHLDEILFIPTGISHFKGPDVVLDKKIRVAMTGGAIEDNHGFALSTIETDRPGNSYTFETLEILKTTNPDTDYYLILGADTLFQIEQWMHPEIIMMNAKILTAVRKGQSTEELKDKAAELMRKFGAEIYVLKTPYIDISSTDIRNRIKEGKSIRYMVADRTLEYIEKHGLYKD